jgi:hypothetical protein
MESEIEVLIDPGCAMLNHPALVYLLRSAVHMIANTGWEPSADGRRVQMEIAMNCCGMFILHWRVLVVLDEAGHISNGQMISKTTNEVGNRKMIIEDDIGVISKRGSNCRR